MMQLYHLDLAFLLSLSLVIRLRFMIFISASRFLSPSYHFSLKEDSHIGYSVGRVIAVDTDANFNKVYYRILSNAPSSTFLISATNGTILLTKELDREIQSVYSLTVEAYNKDRFGNRSLSSSTQVGLQFMSSVQFFYSKSIYIYI